MTTQELAAKVGLTSKAVLSAITRGDLSATRQPRGRLQRTFDITPDDADKWIRWRETAVVRRTLAAVRQKAKRLEENKGGGDKMAFCPNLDNDTMGMAWIDELKVAALRGDEAARERIQRPFGEGGLGVKVWTRAGIGAAS